MQERTAAGTTSGPRLVYRLLHDRALRFAAALAVAVATPVALLFYLQFRSLADLEDASKVVLEQLSEETADGLAKKVEEALKTPHLEVLLRIQARDLEPLNLDVVGQVFAEGLRESTFIDAFYVWSAVQGPYTGEVLMFGRQGVSRGKPLFASVGAEDAGRLIWAGASGFHADSPESDMILERMRGLARYKRAIVLTEENIDGRLNQLVFQLGFSSGAREHMTSFRGYRVDVSGLGHGYLPGVVREHLRSTHGPTGFPPLAVTLLDGNETMVFQTGEGSGSVYVDERTFPLVTLDPDLLPYAAALLPGVRPPHDNAEGEVPEPPGLSEPRMQIWRIRTGYGDRTIEAVVSARTARQRAIMITLAVIMAASVFFIARAAAREVRLAELKSNFVASVSHDLKTPLALIQLFAETLELGRLKTTERAQEYYRIINSEARKLTRLINNILDFSKIEAGLRRYRREATDLAELTGEVLNSLQNQFQQNQFSVTLQAEGDLPAVLVDPEAVEQALQNLISNAMKYSPEHREIAVTVRRQNGFACIDVADRGAGIPRRLQRHIFRKFYRIDNGADTGPPGCGLGLAIVDHIARAHEGFVRVSSEPGRGSTFTIGFPIPLDAESHEADPGRRRRAADAARPA